LRPRSKLTNFTNADVAGSSRGNTVLDGDDDLDYVDLEYDLSDEDDDLDACNPNDGRIQQTSRSK
jgi:hypothetical protein